MQFTSFDGVRLNITEMGEGRPLVLLHGLFSSAEINWIRYGTAQKLADAGWRLILPDLRGHGQSESPENADGWPEDVLSLDMEALVRELGLGDDFVLGGYSLGGRTTARLLARGMKPRAAIISGMGLRGITQVADRGEWFARMIEGRGTWARGTAEFAAETFMKASIKDPDGIIHLMRRQLATPAETLSDFTLPIGVICGEKDQDNGSAPDLAAALPDGRYYEIPGTHMSAVTRPELATAMLEFLGSLDF